MITTTIALCLLQASPLPGAAAAQEPAPPLRVEDGWVHAGFDPGAPPTLLEWIEAAQSILGDTYLVDTTVPDTLHALEHRSVVGYGAKRIAREDFEAFFHSMLRIHGFAIVPSGTGPLEVGVITMKSEANSAAIRANSVFVSAGELAPLAGKAATHVTTVVRLQHADAQDLATTLRTAMGGGPPRTDHSYFLPLAHENAILVQGYGPFVAAAVEWVREIDVELESPRGPAPRPLEFHVYVLQHGDAMRLQGTVQEFFAGIVQAQVPSRARRGPETPVRLGAVADARTNSLLISCMPGQWADLKPLLDALDRPVGEDSGD